MFKNLISKLFDTRAGKGVKYLAMTALMMAAAHTSQAKDNGAPGNLNQTRKDSTTASVQKGHALATIGTAEDMWYYSHNIPAPKPCEEEIVTVKNVSEKKADVKKAVHKRLGDVYTTKQIAQPDTRKKLEVLDHYYARDHKTGKLHEVAPRINRAVSGVTTYHVKDRWDYHSRKFVTDTLGVETVAFASPKTMSMPNPEFQRQQELVSRVQQLREQRALAGTQTPKATAAPVVAQQQAVQTPTNVNYTSSRSHIHVQYVENSSSVTVAQAQPKASNTYTYQYKF